MFVRFAFNFFAVFVPRGHDSWRTCYGIRIRMSTLSDSFGQAWRRERGLNKVENPFNGLLAIVTGSNIERG